MKKIKTGIMLYPDIIKIADENIKISNSNSRNHFIEKSIKHYVGYLNKDDNTDYLNKVIDETLNNKINLFEERLSNVLFKLTVEISMMMQIIAISTNINEKTLELLRLKCTEDVQASIGKINLEFIINKNKKECDD